MKNANGEPRARKPNTGKQDIAAIAGFLSPSPVESMISVTAPPGAILKALLLNWPV